MLTLASLVSSLPKYTVDPSPDRDIPLRKVVVDSRRVGRGDLFVALKGEHDDGHNYIGDAIRAGAAAVLAQWWPDNLGVGPAARVMVPDTLRALQEAAGGWRRKHSVRVIAITGSVGKTSTKDATATLLSRKFKALKSEGNLNTEIGVPLTLLELDDHQKAVIEMGMYLPGDIALLCKIALPQVGVVTNVGPSHLERTGSLEATAKAKGELVEALPPEGLAILNGDDPLVRSMSSGAKAKVLYYGTQEGLDLRATDVKSRGLSGITFSVKWQGQGRRLETCLIGVHSVYTALAAAAVALNEGMEMEEVAEGLKHLESGNRIKVIPGPGGSVILDDTYNSSPASCLAALSILEEMKGERIAVLGDMLELGDAEEEGHRSVGRRAAEVASCLITLGQRARTIAEEARAAGLKDVRAVSSHDEVVVALRGALRRDCYVLVKGSRGLAMENIVKKLCE